LNAISNNGSLPTRHDSKSALEIPIALFDASHGQPNWAQTGFTSREMHTNFAGLTEMLCRLGFRCRTTTNGESLAQHLPKAKLLVLPSPTGRYDVRRERWRCDPSTLFAQQHVQATLNFLESGGSLLAFAYRFGDSFTQTNLGDIFAALGCRLNDDAVIDASAVRQVHPLEIYFDTPLESLPLQWSRAGVAAVRWRPAATFTLVPADNIWPLVLSTGGRCLSFNRTLRRISFESLPLAVAGRHGRGRFALFGGPHLFETSPLGLLAHGDNARFLKNVIAWLRRDNEARELPAGETIPVLIPGSQSGLTHVESYGNGERTISSVERVLRKTGILKALCRARWMP